MRPKTALAAALCAGALAVPAAANTVIDFTGVAYTLTPSPYPGPPMVLAFSSYSEGGFNVTAAQAGWEVSLTYGNPRPDVFWPNRPNQSAPLSLVVDGGGAVFSFLSLDMASAARSSFTSTRYAFTGFLAGSQVFSETGTFLSGGVLPPFATVSAAHAGTAIDSLTITLLGSSGITHIDNITLGPATVAQVPEPAQAGLFAAGALALAVLRRRRA